MGNNKLNDFKNIGRKFGRPDVERCDLFIDEGFLNWGKYTGKPVEFRESCQKGVQMLSSVPSGGHKKCGIHILAGYFDPEFRTIAINDKYVEKWKMTGRPTPHPRKGPWIPNHPASKHSTPGDNYGTFTSNYKAFSPLTREQRGKRKPEALMNFLTNPGKKGNSGYADICINKYPPHDLNGKVDSYLTPELLYSKNWKLHKEKMQNGPFKAGFYPRNFDEQPYKNAKIESTYVQRPEKVYGTSRGLFYPPAAPKKPGNNHDGCFEKFTTWTPEPYMTPAEAIKKLEKKKTDLIFRPEPRQKTYYTFSIVNYKADVACNERTWRTMKPITYPQFNL